MASALAHLRVCSVYTESVMVRICTGSGSRVGSVMSARNASGPRLLWP